MPKRGISQEGLKLIACLTMLIDHIGATIVYTMYLNAYYAGDYAVSNAIVPVYQTMRIIGRIAFPIYCFLLVEGAHYTRSPKKYALRLFVGMLLSEIPFDLAFSGAIDWESCSVMVTLLLGFGMIMAMDRVKGFWKIAVIVPFFLLAEWLRTDYAGNGLAIIALMALTKDRPGEKLLRSLGLVVLLWFGPAIQVGPVQLPMELFGLLGLIPMLSYQGKKRTASKTVQWAFYLFYPVHLLVLALLEVLLFG